MKKGAFWFTLVELLVGITISSLLMIGVSILVSNGIQNITGQREIINNSKSENDIYQNIIQKINKWKWDAFTITGSWFLLKQDVEFSQGWFSYIGTKFLTWAYCTSTGSDFQNLSHLIIKDFIPFEWEGGNYFDDIVYKKWPITVKYNEAILEDGVVTYTGELLWPTWVYESGSIIYIADTKWHKVVKYDAWTFTKIIGKWSPWNSIIWNMWSAALWVYINSPTWIIEGSGGLFISDTLNDRVLYYNFWLQKVYEFLWRKDGVSEPTWLYYDSVSQKLFIANTGKWEILSVIVGETIPSSNSFSVPFTPWTGSNVNNINISFFTGSLSSPINLTWPTNTGSISFSWWITQWEDYIWIGGSLRYFFANYSWVPNSQPSCPWAGQYILSWTTPIKCTQTGTGIVWTLQSKNFSSGSFWITINNLIQWNFSSPWNYYARVQLLNNATLLWEKFIPFFTTGDNNITTMGDNIITQFVTGLTYPTWVYKRWINLVVNDFFERKEYTYNITSWTIVSTTNLPDFNFNALPQSKEDIVFKNPMESFDVEKVWDLLTFKWKYYNNFSCVDGNKKGEAHLYFKKDLWN